MGPLLSVIIVVFNRREALARTLVEVSAALERLGTSIIGSSADVPDLRSAEGQARPPEPAWAGIAEIIVVDNSSTDGSTVGLDTRFPHCRVLRLERNTGVAAFNRGVEAATGKYVLILDDDAWPAGPSPCSDLHPGSLSDEGHRAKEPAADALNESVAFLENEPGASAVMFQPIHPRTGALEWPFDRVKGLTRNWPDLRCANLVRREAWIAVGGYEEAFFLYRNDTDLALKLLGSGRDVVYNPAWHAMHDSPHIAIRRVRWFTLSTRNWCWMCRRHARGLAWVLPAFMGWCWAHRLAGLSPARHWATLRGGIAGLFAAAPPPPVGVARDGKALRRLITLKRELRHRR